MKVLFAGAHPDDIEIGSSLLVSLCLGGEFDVRFLVLTNEQLAYTSSTRKAETLRALRVLGRTEQPVIFAGFPDGWLQVNSASVQRVRRLFNRWSPDIVITHTSNDSHQDHRAANALMRAVFRSAHFLFFSVYLSGESTFAPALVIQGSPADWLAKEQALLQFETQTGRLRRASCEEWENRFCTCGRLEGYESLSQAGASLSMLRVFIRTTGLKTAIHPHYDAQQGVYSSAPSLS